MPTLFSELALMVFSDVVDANWPFMPEHVGLGQRIIDQGKAAIDASHRQRAGWGSGEIRAVEIHRKWPASAVGVVVARGRNNLYLPGQSLNRVEMILKLRGRG